MSPRRTRPLGLSPTDQPRVIAWLAEGRRACVKVVTDEPAGSPAEKAAHAAMSAVDDLVEALTGNRALLWARDTGTVGSRSDRGERST